MNELSRAVADVALSVVWQSGVVALAALAALRLLRRASGRTRHAVAVCALIVAAVVPFAGPLSRSFARLDRATTAPVDAASPAPSSSLPGDFMTMRVRVNNPPVEIAYAVAAVYLLLVIHATIALMLAVRHARRLRRATPSRIRRCGGVPLHFSDAVTAPATVGLFRPAILLPATLARPLLHAVLRHELAHVRRRDALVQFFVDLLTLPVAFHPLVRCLKNEAALAREMACDEYAIASHVERHTYAQALLAVAARHVAPSHALPFGERTALERRIRALFNGAPRRGLAAAVVAIAVVAAIAGATARAPLAFFGSGRDRLAGHWVLDRTATRFGPIAPYQAFAQSIAYDGERVQSWQTRRRDGRTINVNWTVHTDGAARPVAVNGMRGKGSARWVGDTLLIELTTADGHWEQTRAVVHGHHTLVCEGEVRDRRGGGAFRFVFRRAENA